MDFVANLIENYDSERILKIGQYLSSCARMQGLMDYMAQLFLTRCV